MSSKVISSASTHGKDPPKNSSPATEPISILSLPHDLLLYCIARVSRLDYLTLSFVSKTFRSIIASSELYKTRSLLNRTEKCLYLCLRFTFNPNTIWFTIRRRTVTNKKSDYLMVRIPSPKYLLPAEDSTLVAVGSNIYKIGGSDNANGGNFFDKRYSSRVSVLDCHSHTWKQAPSMTMKRNSSSTASVVDGKIYVAGGCEVKYLSYPNWIEVFDPKTKTWENVKNPRIFRLHEEYRNKGFIAKSFEINGKLYMFGDDGAVYNPKEGTWNDLGENRPMIWSVRDSYCVVDDVLFYCDQGVFIWYDLKVSLWKELKGVDGLPDFRVQKISKMVDLGGKIAVLWEEYEYTQYCKEVRIWCAEVSLERRDGDEIWGKVEWLDYLLIVPLPEVDDITSASFDALAASV